MSNCCTPQYITIKSFTPTGDLTLSRGTGEPNCGYSGYYTGNPDFNNYDYYSVDIQYNTGSGFWTFSGDSFVFQNQPVYLSTKTGNPCDPYGNYTGVIYNINVSPVNKWGVFEFEPSFEYDKENIGILGKGKAVHSKKDVTFNMSFYNNAGTKLNSSKAQSSRTFNGATYDIINILGEPVYENYFSGYKTRLTITEEENIKLFGSYQKDFGIKIQTKDAFLGNGGAAEFYTYGNLLHIGSVQVNDALGTTTWQTNVSGIPETEGVSPSGKLVNALSLKANIDNNMSYVTPSHFDVYVSDKESFDIKDSGVIRKRIPIIESKKQNSVTANESWGMKPNKDYWFGLVGYSKLGSGNLVKVGPNKISRKEEASENIQGGVLNLGYNDSSFQESYKTGSITEEVSGNSGIIDKIFVDTGNFGSQTTIYKDNKIVLTTIKTKSDGEWSRTTFDYLLEFKDPTNPYSTLSKNIKLTATGMSIDPFNSGMPLFLLEDSNTGQVVKVQQEYKASGFYLMANTGHQYDSFKYVKKTL